MNKSKRNVYNWKNVKLDVLHYSTAMCSHLPLSIKIVSCLPGVISDKDKGNHTIVTDVSLYNYQYWLLHFLLMKNHFCLFPNDFS